jgi:hypothetical protein
MSSARKYQLAFRSQPVTETDRLDEVAEAGHAVARGLDNFARAVCVLAVKHEARNPENNGSLQRYCGPMW